MAMAVDNLQILKFYVDKPAQNETCQFTAKYLDKLKEADPENTGDSLHGPYKRLVRVFKTGVFVNREKETLTDDEKFYIWMKDHELFSWLMESTFQIPDIFLQATDYYQVALQKWHLYLSWYAYLDSKILGKGLLLRKNAVDFKCPELLLWMCEAAGSEKTEHFYNELLDMEASDSQGVYRKALPCWAAKIRKEIEQIIGECQ